MEYEITLTALTYGGDAMGRLPDQRAIFVPYGLPGERVRVRLTEEKRNFARGQLVEVLEASPQRIAPRCLHFGECGGCHYQNLSYDDQLKAKTEILRDQLRRIGRIENPPVQGMVPSPSPWNYRNQVQFHLTATAKLGYISQYSGDRGIGVMAITECHLPEGSINALWPQLEFEPGTDVERVSVRSGVEDELMLVLESESPQPPEVEIEAGISITHVFGKNTVVVAGNDSFTIRVLDRDFRVSAASFFQVNTAVAEKMVEHILSQLPVSQTSTLLDIYSGVGLFSAFLAPRYQRVIGIESSPSSCEDFVFNLDEFENVELYEGLAEEILPSLVKQIVADPTQGGGNPPCVVVDPPRAGLDKEVVDGILKLEPRIIAYVSCDPSTLARDAARLMHGGYKLKQVTPFDLFPQTFHIESISIFER